MGHYWSEMRGIDPPRHPTPLETLGFREVSSYDCRRQYYHEPCLLMFYIPVPSRLPDAIWNHSKTCNQPTKENPYD